MRPRRAWQPELGETESSLALGSPRYVPAAIQAGASRSSSSSSRVSGGCRNSWAVAASPRRAGRSSSPANAPSQAAWRRHSNLEVEAVAAKELGQIHALMKAKSGRLLEQERNVQKQRCELAEAIGEAQTLLRSEVASLLEASQQQLRIEVAKQRRRLDELFERAQREFRKAWTCRRDMKAMREHASEQVHLSQRLQESQRRCHSLVEKDRVQRKAMQQERENVQKQLQQLEVERGQWQFEREHLSTHQRQLEQELAHLRASRAVAIRDVGCYAGSDKLNEDALKLGEVDALQVLLKSVGDEYLRPVFTDTCSRATASTASDRQSTLASASKAHPHQRCGHQDEDSQSAPLLGAWWCINALYTSSEARRDLWGYVFLLARTAGAPWCGGGGELHEDVRGIALSFVRRWSWELLLKDAQAAWQATLEVVLGASREVSKNGSANGSMLAWARQQRQRSSSRGADAAALAGLLGDPGVAPCKLWQWIPPEAGPWNVLRATLSDVLKPSQKAELSATRAGKLLLLEPSRAQLHLAGELWRDTREQLLLAEALLRDGEAEPEQLAEFGQMLLTVAALAAELDDTMHKGALRSLTRLLTSHAKEVRHGLCDALPIVLWMADACSIREGVDHSDDDDAAGANDEAQDLVTALLNRMTPWRSSDNVQAACIAAAALLRMPTTAPLAKPLTLLLHEVLRHGEPRVVVSLRRFPLLVWSLRRRLQAARDIIQQNRQGEEGQHSSFGALEHIQGILTMLEPPVQDGEAL